MVRLIGSEPTFFPPHDKCGLSTYMSIVPSIPSGTTVMLMHRLSTPFVTERLKYLYPTTDPSVLFTTGLWFTSSLYTSPKGGSFRRMGFTYDP